MPKSTAQILIDAFTVMLLIANWWMAASAYPRLPETIPSHFNLRGEVDGWARRWTIFLLPAVATALYGLHTWLLGRPDIPRPTATPLRLLKLEVTALFTYLTWCVCAVAFGRARRLGRGVWGLLLVVIATALWMGLVTKKR